MSYLEKVLNLQEYKNKKNLERLALKKEEKKHRKICTKCHRAIHACFCKGLDSFNTNSRFVILMHPKEAKKEKVGTGRLTHICLKNSEIIVDINFNENQRLNELFSNPQFLPILLYPGEDSHNISTSRFSSGFLKNRTPLFLIIDGTWACAKTMMRESSILHNIPRVSFDVTKESRFDVKVQPAKFCLSTIESVYELISGLDAWGHENTKGSKEVLNLALKKVVDYQIECANDPNRASYRSGKLKLSKDVETAKKWEKWKICYEDKNYQNQKFPNGLKS